MSEENCSHDCASCGESCGARQLPPKAPLNEKSKVRHVIAVVSGKGGVGKTTICGMIIDRLIQEKIRELDGRYEQIVLAQISMAGAAAATALPRAACRRTGPPSMTFSARR